MPLHHPPAHAWLITDERLGPDLLDVLRRLPRGHGVIFRHHHLPPAERRRALRRLRRLAHPKGLVLVDDACSSVARVHSARELRQALLSRPRLLFISPMFATRSHPDWKPLGRMQAAALVRLAKRPVLALGGMTAPRFGEVRRLGFVGWGGIDAWGNSARERRSREQVP